MENRTEGSRAERRRSARARRQLSKVGLNAKSVHQFVEQVVGEDLHVKTVLSVSLATLGVLHAASLCIHVIGRALAWARGANPKHCVKQVDRLLSNENVSPWGLTRQWVQFVVMGRKELLVALDWTDFDGDDQATLALYLITRHGRATPLVWKTVEKARLKQHRNQYESEVLEQLHAVLAADVRVTVLADRGFGDQKRYEHIRSLGWDYVIRFRQGIKVTDQWGKQQPAAQRLTKTGRAKMLKEMAVTDDCYVFPAVVLAHDKRMQEPWCLATSRADLSAAQVVKLYGRRFRIEESFRDIKDVHFGMGLSATNIRNPARRDRLLFIAALAQVLLTLLGAAGERAGLDRLLKANTSKRRTLSLYNQGLYWYSAIPNLPKERLVQLMNAYTEVLREHELTRDLLGVIRGDGSALEELEPCRLSLHGGRNARNDAYVLPQPRKQETRILHRLGLTRLTDQGQGNGQENGQGNG
jgi:hypothetical protein